MELTIHEHSIYQVFEHIFHRLKNFSMQLKLFYFQKKKKKKFEKLMK